MCYGEGDVVVVVVVEVLGVVGEGEEVVGFGGFDDDGCGWVGVDEEVLVWVWRVVVVGVCVLLGVVVGDGVEEIELGVCFVVVGVDEVGLFVVSDFFEGVFEFVEEGIGDVGEFVEFEFVVFGVGGVVGDVVVELFVFGLENVVGAFFEEEVGFVLVFVGVDGNGGGGFVDFEEDVGLVVG